MACVVKPITFIDLSSSDPLSGDDEQEIEDPLSTGYRNMGFARKQEDDLRRGFKGLCKSDPVTKNGIQIAEPDLHGFYNGGGSLGEDSEIDVTSFDINHTGDSASEDSEIDVTATDINHPGVVLIKDNFAIIEVSKSIWLDSFATVINKIGLSNSLDKSCPGSEHTSNAKTSRASSSHNSQLDGDFKAISGLNSHHLLESDDKYLKNSLDLTSVSKSASLPSIPDYEWQDDTKFSKRIPKKPRGRPKNRKRIKPASWEKESEEWKSHLFRERERRKHIQSMFSQLAQAMNLTDITYSKIHILNLAINDILQLKQKVHLLKDIKKSLKQRQQQLLSNLSHPDKR